jgi:arsenate reductase
LCAQEDSFTLNSPVATLAHPILINRPIVVTPKGTRLRRPSEAVLDLLENPATSFVKEDGEHVTRAKS